MRWSLGRAIKLAVGLIFLVSINLFVMALYSNDSLSRFTNSGPETVAGDSAAGGHSNRLLGQVETNIDVKGLHQNISHSRLARSLRDHSSNLQQSVRNNRMITKSSPKFHLPSPGPRRLEVGDIFISVKTTKAYHRERLDLLLETWVQHVQEVTYFFTDEDDEEFNLKTRGHMINTNCSAGHKRQSLCCKMSVEYDYFMASKKKWFCHADDDTYINIPALLRLLSQYNHTDDVYLGKPSLNHPLEVAHYADRQRKIAFWFGTGGAGICISKGLALKMLPHTGGGRLRSMCEATRLPDDCTIGYIIADKLGKTLTKVSEFHSHLEFLPHISQHKLEEQITLSYMCTESGVVNAYAEKNNRCNTVNVPGFPIQEDLSRFRSIHCILYPNTRGCPPRSV